MKTSDINATPQPHTYWTLLPPLAAIVLDGVASQSLRTGVDSAAAAVAAVSAVTAAGVLGVAPAAGRE